MSGEGKKRKPRTLLSDDQVMEISDRVSRGEMQITLAAEFNVDQSTISHILKKGHRRGLALVGVNRKCAVCGAPFRPTSWSAMMCSSKCKTQ